MRENFLGRVKKALESFSETNRRDVDGDFGEKEKKAVTDGYLQHAWVSIAVDLLMRNVARASFEVRRNGEVVADSQAARLFARPNEGMSTFDLWKETAAWWSLEGEAFWWFGSGYVCGLPTELYVLNPRFMSQVVVGGRIVRWVYSGGDEEIPCTLLADEVVHFKDWNPWNRWRGVCPLLSLTLELEQDVLAGKANTELLKEGGIPKGLLKTDQIIREDEADQLERRWESKYGKGSGKRKVAVIGKGTSYQPLMFSPDVLKLFELKRWNLYTILAKYGIPPRVANIQDVRSSLSGSDTAEQHAAFWKYTLIPLLENFQQIADVQFFKRFGLSETGVFNLASIPELQRSEDEQSRRDIEEINAGLKTINDVLRERGLPPKSWGDVWWKPANVECVGGME